MGEVQRVEPAALTAQSAEMRGQSWHNPNADPVVPPDVLPSTNDAIANLNENADALLKYQQWAETENNRIAEMLEIAAAAYLKVDEQYGRALEDPERQTAVEAIAVPAPSTPPPPIPDAPAAPRMLSASGYSEVRKTQADLLSGDDAASLKAAMLQWGVAATRVRDNAPAPPPGNWEGEAADAAYTRMTTFGAWLQQLGDAWQGLAEAAAQIVAAHAGAKSEHTAIANEYETLEKRLRELAAQAGVGNSVATAQEMERIQKRMAELQQRSDEVREEYANNASFSPVRPAEPPFSSPDATTTAGGGGGGGAGPPGGAPASLAERMGQSLGQPQADTAATRSPSGSGTPSGGGAPSGGGSPGGGSPGGGSPGGLPGGPAPTGTPKVPIDPSLRPAAASGGGAAGAGGGGGGGRGMPSSAMSPAVTAETVAPVPVVPAASGAAAPPAATGAMAGGAMGGMAPMAGAGAQQGKEKRRNPRLAPDEDLYSEDRPWTESVVGDRRRREVQDGKDSQ